MSSNLSKLQEFSTRVFVAGELATALRAVVDRYAVAPGEVTFGLKQRLPDGSSSYRSNVPLRELEIICDIAGVSIDTSFDAGENRRVLLSLDAAVGDENLTIHVSSDTASLVNDVLTTLQAALALEVAETAMERLQKIVHSRRASLLDLADRIDALELAVFSPARRLRCFLSYRFAPEDELLALRLQQFLSLVDVEVLTGASYEPRTIQEKVLSRLREDLDFVVLLITASGESMWTRDEIATALHRGIAVVPLVESGATFQQGLFGNVEFVEFAAGHIADAFVKLLEAIRFIRAQRSASEKDR